MKRRGLADPLTGDLRGGSGDLKVEICFPRVQARSVVKRRKVSHNFANLVRIRFFCQTLAFASSIYSEMFCLMNAL
jgi:hypothetical protein